MLVNVHDAKTNLSKLLAAVEAGEEVVIGRAGVPVAKLVKVVKVAPGKLRRRRAPTSWKGQVWIDPDIKEFEDEMTALFESSVIFPDED